MLFLLVFMTTMDEQERVLWSVMESVPGSCEASSQSREEVDDDEDDDDDPSRSGLFDVIIVRVLPIVDEHSTHLHVGEEAIYTDRPH